MTQFSWTYMTLAPQQLGWFRVTRLASASRHSLRAVSASASRRGVKPYCRGTVGRRTSAPSRRAPARPARRRGVAVAGPPRSRVQEQLGLGRVTPVLARAASGPGRVHRLDQARRHEHDQLGLAAARSAPSGTARRAPAGRPAAASRPCSPRRGCSSSPATANVWPSFSSIVVVERALGEARDDEAVEADTRVVKSRSLTSGRDLQADPAVAQHDRHEVQPHAELAVLDRDRRRRRRRRPAATGIGNSPPARKLASCPLMATRFGSARMRSRLFWRSAVTK